MGVKVKSSKVCLDCGIKHQIELPETVSLDQFNSDVEKCKEPGNYIQDVMNYLDKSSREILISGLCDEAFKLVSTDDDEPEFDIEDEKFSIF